MSVEGYIRKKSTRYNSLLRCEERVSPRVRYYKKNITRIITYKSSDDYNTCDEKEIFRQFVHQARDEVEEAVEAIKGNLSLLEEVRAIIDADYMEYSECEYAGYKYCMNYEFEDYLDVENEMCMSVKFDIPTDFAFKIVIVLIDSDTKQQVAEKSYSYDIYDTYKMLCSKKSVQVDKGKEKIIAKERLKLDQHKCQICGRSKEQGASLVVRYKVSPSSGGDVSVDNMFTVCRDCIARLK